MYCSCNPSYCGYMGQVEIKKKKKCLRDFHWQICNKSDELLLKNSLPRLSGMQKVDDCHLIALFQKLVWENRKHWTISWSFLRPRYVADFYYYKSCSIFPVWPQRCSYTQILAPSLHTLFIQEETRSTTQPLLPMGFVLWAFRADWLLKGGSFRARKRNLKSNGTMIILLLNTIRGREIWDPIKVLKNCRNKSPLVDKQHLGLSKWTMALWDR